MAGDAGTGALTDAERAYIAGAVPKRVGEFAAARVCARRAIGRVRRVGGASGAVPGAVVDLVPDLVPGPERDVTWPAGLVGAITHCAGLRAAVVAPSAQVLSLGIDAEVNEALPEDAWSMVSVSGEEQMLGQLGGCAGVNLDRLLFSAKESIFKAWFPLTRRWLDFTECRLTVRVDSVDSGDGGWADDLALPVASGTFRGDFLVPGIDVPTSGGSPENRVTGLNGRWCATESHLLTAVSLGR